MAERDSGKGDAAQPSLVHEISRGIEADLGHHQGLQLAHFALFPLAVVSSLAPPAPAVTRKGALDEHARIGYLSRVEHLWPMGLAAGLGFVLLVALARRTPDAWPISWGCAAIVGSYWIMYLFYGDELFLYALHWQLPLLVLIGVSAAGARSMRSGVAALALLIGIAAGRSALVIPLLLRQWSAVQGG